ncbi:MMPL family transporter [Streptomyces sp. JJ36]|uniref:MMPL family transporter n=1 Tax=Streptomyces sp. JJ36 TaxID=2736645 RepID=UPI001F0072CE|nr:MMPL family transporter [Streptomyces sp. JJ36]MCF6522393.1 MMPL family transporter [Streptomyces sp. JJ36]
MAALARWCLRRRLLVAVLWLVALAGTAAAATAAGSAYSNDYAVPETASGRAATLLAEGFPDRAGDSSTVVWRSAGTPDGVREAGVEQRMTRLLADLGGQPAVSRVTGPYGSGDARLISDDGHTAYARLHFRGPVEDLPEDQVAAVRGLAREARGDVPGLEVALGGRGLNLAEAGSGSARVSEAVGVLAAAAVLLFAFGSFAAMLLPLVTALVSVGTGYLGIQLLGHVTTVADFAPMLGTLIGLGVGIDYALFIVTRHRRGLKEGLPVAVAAERALASAGRAVVFAGVTVCIALLGMLVLRLDFLFGVAVAGSLTVLLAVLASVTLLPALLGAIGRRALSRRERRRRAADPAAEEGTTGAARWSAFVERRPRLLGALAAAVMLALALPVLGLRLGTPGPADQPAGSAGRQAYDLLAEGFGPGVNGPLTLVAELDGAAGKLAFGELTGTLREVPGVAGVTGSEVNGSGEVGAVTVVPETGPQDGATSRLVERLRTDVLPEAVADRPLRVHVGGPTAGQDDFAAAVLDRLPAFLATVVALGCALLLLAFRSVGIPLKAALMNVLAVAASFGVVVAVFQWGWGSGLLGLGGAGPVEPFLPVVMIAVLFGLSMDYQVFLVSRMYEEWRATGDNRRAVRVGLAETGRVINCAAAIMIAVFGAFVLSGDRIIAMFGIGLATAVALDAYVLRTLLVPALMHLLGGANWWLPAWVERRLPRIGIETPAAAPAPAPAPAAAPAPAPASAAVGAHAAARPGAAAPEASPAVPPQHPSPTGARGPAAVRGSETRP